MEVRSKLNIVKTPFYLSHLHSIELQMLIRRQTPANRSSHKPQFISFVIHHLYLHHFAFNSHMQKRNIFSKRVIKNYDMHCSSFLSCFNAYCRKPTSPQKHRNRISVLFDESWCNDVMSLYVNFTFSFILW